MRDRTPGELLCPQAECDQVGLEVQSWKTGVCAYGQLDILEGVVSCPGCGSVYPVAAGVLILIGDLKSYLRDHLGVMIQLDGPEKLSSAMRDWLVRHASDDLDPAAVSRSMRLESRYVEVFVGAHFPSRQEIHEDGAISDFLKNGAVGGLWSTTAQFIEDLRPARALDVGCSVGGLSAQLSKYAGTVGIDTSFLSVLAARRIMLGSPSAKTAYRAYHEGDRYEEIAADVRRGAHDVEFIVASGLSPAIVEPVDMVCAVNLIDLVPDPVALIDSLAAQVVTGGHILITSPYGWSGVSKARWIGGTDTSSADALREALGAVGFEVLRDDDRVPWFWRDYSRFWRLYFVHSLLAKKL